MDLGRPKRRSFVAPAVMLLASVVLAGGSCFGFLNTLSFDGRGRHPNLNLFFLIVFCLCVIAFLGAIIWMIARAVRNSRANERGAE